MADIFGDGFAWLNEQMTAHASKTYTYRRGANSVELECTVCGADTSPLTTLAMAVAERDFVNPSAKHADYQFFFPAADLILNGSLTTPQDGDTIERTVDGVTTKWKLATPWDGTQPWGYVSEGHEDGDEARLFFNGRLYTVT